MKRHWKKVVIGLVALVALVFAASFIYAKWINDPPAKKTEQDAIDIVQGSGVPGTDATGDTATGSTDGAGTPGTVGADGVTGTWAPAADSELCYRVKESINGFDTEGVGCSNSITGSLVIDGTVVSSADFTVDMTTFSSDESRRDGQFNGRIMEVSQFPTGTFVLTGPLDFGAIPADGETITVTATGELTLHGVTNTVTFELSAAFGNGRIGVFGNIPVTFADYDITNPSFGTISTEDHGLLEFVLAFDPA